MSLLIGMNCRRAGATLSPGADPRAVDALEHTAWMLTFVGVSE